MLGRCPRSSLHRTSKGELGIQSHEILHLPSSGDEKPVLQPPHQIVIGFDLGADTSIRNSPMQACESPRSVLEPHHLCFRSHHQPVRSPRSPLSALGSLLSGAPPNVPCTEGAALCVKVAIKAEEAAASAKAHHALSRSGLVASDFDGVNAYPGLLKKEHMADHHATNKQNDLFVSSRTNRVEFRKNRPCNHVAGDFVSNGSCTNCLHTKTFLGSDGEDEDKSEAAAATDVGGEGVDIPASIFSTASPVANYAKSDFLAVDFLSKCFLCKRHLLLGKDIYMYRGDRAFCSQDCRYQQIVVDERKERRPAAVTCVSGASSRHQRLQRANQAAVA